jgi:hypothetical protein
MEMQISRMKALMEEVIPLNQPDEKFTGYYGTYGNCIVLYFLNIHHFQLIFVIIIL